MSEHAERLKAIITALRDHIKEEGQMYGTRRFNPHKLVSQEIVFKPSPTGENIARAVEALNLTGVTICGITVNRDDPAPAPTEQEMEKQYRDMLAEQPAPQAEKLPDDFVNLSCVNGRWYVDRVNLKAQKVEAVAMRHTYIAAKRFAASYAGKLDLPTREGSYTLPALESERGC